MDKAVFSFEGPDRMSSQWTWYQQGKERWMEQIVLYANRACHPAGLTPRPVSTIVFVAAASPR